MNSLAAGQRHPAKVDWFDDAAWACVANNFGVAAEVARQSRCKGFMFDTEQYEGATVFDYRQQKDKDKKTFAEYQARIRQRGREWVQAVNKHYPHITILLQGSLLDGWKASAYRACNRSPRGCQDPPFRSLRPTSVHAR